MVTNLPLWREHLASLRYLAAKVAGVHGSSHPDTAVLASVMGILVDAPSADALVQRALGQRIAILTNDFQPWAGACGSVQRLFAGLKAVVAALPGPGPATS